MLGCLLTDAESADFINSLETSDFYFREHAKLFATIKKLHSERRPLDIITVSSEGHDISFVGGLTYSAIPVSCRNHVTTIKTLSAKRQVALKAKNLIRDMGKVTFGTPAEVTEYVAGKMDLGIRDEKGIPENLTDIAVEFIDHLQSIKDETIKPIMYGMRDIDRMTGGLWGAELTIIAAPPGIGKTAFALNITTAAAKTGCKVELFTLEMNRTQIFSRMVAQTRYITAEVLKRPKDITPDEWGEVGKATIEISKLPVSVIQTVRTIEEVRNKCERKREKGQLDLVVVDYLQLLKSSAKHESRLKEVEHISRELKTMTRDLGVPVIALSQLNREGQKTNARPKLYDLRESGSLEQDADNVIFLHNPNPDETIGHLVVDLEVIVAKQRNGNTGMVKMAFDKKYMRFFGKEK